MRLNTIILSLGLLLSPISASAITAPITPIPSAEYYSITLNALNNSQKSITLVMYLISINPNEPNSQPQKLLNALVEAKNRGVIIKVILDQNLNFLEDSTDNLIAQNKNQNAYEYLLKHNIPVYFDTSETYTHSKVIIIDEEKVILGSTNWSKSALTRNHETNVLIESKELAQSILNEISQIKLEPYIPQGLTPTIKIPLSIISNKKILSEMTSQSDQRAFDTYLYILKEFDHNKDNTLTLNYDHLAEYLNINKMSKEDYRRQITKTLEKLDQKYHLIKFTKPPRNQNTVIKLNPPKDPKTLSIPTTFFRYNYHQTLPFSAKVMYLINLTYSQNSPEGSFSIPRKTISKDYKISESFISEGNQHLRKNNLLKIQYSSLEDQQYQERQPNIYTPKPLYNPEDTKKQLKLIEQKYSYEKFKDAQKIASIVYEEQNPQTIQVLLDLEEEYGKEVINKALQKISQKSPDNPKRSAGYLINTIKSIAQEEQTIS